MGHNDSLSIVDRVLIVALFMRLLLSRVILLHQVAPDRLRSLEVLVVFFSDETHMSHDLDGGHLADQRVLIDLKLSQYFIQVLLEALH